MIVKMQHRTKPKPNNQRAKERERRKHIGKRTKKNDVTLVSQLWLSSSSARGTCNDTHLFFLSAAAAAAARFSLVVLFTNFLCVFFFRFCYNFFPSLLITCISVTLAFCGCAI